MRRAGKSVVGESHITASGESLDVAVGGGEEIAFVAAVS